MINALARKLIEARHKKTCLSDVIGKDLYLRIYAFSIFKCCKRLKKKIIITLSQDQHQQRVAKKDKENSIYNNIVKNVNKGNAYLA